jgi:hypothetical protein
MKELLIIASRDSSATTRQGGRNGLQQGFAVISNS